jgi:hypothetical protein
MRRPDSHLPKPGWHCAKSIACLRDRAQQTPDAPALVVPMPLSVSESETIVLTAPKLHHKRMEGLPPGQRGNHAAATNQNRGIESGRQRWGARTMSPFGIGRGTPARICARAGTAPLLAFVVVSTIAVLPILLHSYLPLVDLPNHISRHYIAANPGGTLSQYYDYTWAPVPNSAADIFWYLLGHPGDPVRFSQILMAGYAVGLIAATMVLARIVHGYWTVWSAAAALCVYNLPFYWGFQNFLLSVPFAILGLALWLAMERRSNALRAIVFVPLGLGLYLLHFFAFAALAAAAFGRECHRLIAVQPLERRRQTLKMVISAVPFLVPIFVLFPGAFFGSASPAALRTVYGGLNGRWFALISPVHYTNSPMLWSYAVLLFLAVAFLTVFRRSGLRLVLNPRMFGPIIVLLVLSLATPSLLNYVALAQIRMPLIFVLLMLAATVPRTSRRQSIVLAFALVAVLASRSHVMDRIFSDFDSELRDIRATLEKLPDGARLAPIWGERDYGSAYLMHLGAYAVPWHNAFVPSLFQNTHALEYRSEWREFTYADKYPFEFRSDIAADGTQEIPYKFAADWQQGFSYALLLDSRLPVPEERPGLRRIAQSGSFILFEISPQR